MRPRDLAALEFEQVLRRVADFARSPAGKAACRKLAPLLEPVAVEGALAATFEATELLATAGDLPLGEFPDVRESLRIASRNGSILDGASLVQIRSVLDASEDVRIYLRRHVGPFPSLAGLPERIVPLRELRATLRRCLDDNGVVADDASEELAELRREIRHLRGRLQRRLEDMLHRPGVEETLSDHFVTLRNNRFVLPVKTSSAAHFEGVVQDRSASGETMFIEPLFAVEMNNRLIMATKEEERLVQRILADLTDLVRTDGFLVEATFDALVEIDALAARARFGVEFRCTRPILDEEQVRLHDARHPGLLFQGVDVTPIDIRLDRGQHVLVITGPNTGGKTVALKTLGLVVLMAQSGLLVPAADGALLPCFRAVFTDVGDEQSIERNLSTFSAHVKNLAEILAAPERPALVLLDEPGVGTDPEEGAAIGIGLIRVLEARGTRVVVTTHYPAIKVFTLGHPSCVTAAVDFDLAGLRPLYRLVYDSIGESLAIPIARRLGMPEEVLVAAEAARSDQARALAEAMARLETTRRDYERKEAEAETRQREASSAGEEAERLLTDLREKRRRRWTEELGEAERFLRDLREKGRELLVAIEKGEADRSALQRFLKEADEAIRNQTEVQVAPPAVSAEAVGREPRIGDQVEVGTRGIRGELVSVAGERAWIQRGSLRFEVPRASLRCLEAAPSAQGAVEVHVDRGEEAVSVELRLVGLRVREALERLERFLDDAARGGIRQVRIVHGLGSGALRRAVAEFLSDSAYCSGFHAGEPAEGGAGVTVVDVVGL